MYYIQVVLGFQWTALGLIHGKLLFLHMCKSFSFVETTKEIFSHYSPFSIPSPFGTTIMHMLLCLILPHRFLRLCSHFLALFSLLLKL